MNCALKQSWSAHDSIRCCRLHRHMMIHGSHDVGHPPHSTHFSLCLPFTVENTHSSVKCEIETLAQLADVIVRAIRFKVKVQHQSHSLRASGNAFDRLLQASRTASARKAITQDMMLLWLPAESNKGKVRDPRRLSSDSEG